RTKMLLERVLLSRRIAEAEFQLRRGGNAAVEQIAAAARAGARGERRLEELRGKLDDFVQRLAALLLRLRLARHPRQRNAGLLRKPLHRFGKTHPFGEHQKIENVAVLA